MSSAYSLLMNCRRIHVYERNGLFIFMLSRAFLPPSLPSFIPLSISSFWALATDVTMVFFQSRHTFRLSFLPLFADGGMWRSRGSGP